MIIPQLRFPEFTDEWQASMLSEYLSHSKFKNGDSEFDKSQVLSVAAEAGVVNQIEYHGRSYAGVSVKPYNIVRSGEIVYTKSPLKAYPYGIIKLNEGKDGIVSTLYAVYRINKKASGKFLNYYFYHPPRVNKYLKPLVNIGAKNDMKVNDDTVLHGLVRIPGFAEQQKIADFMGGVDIKLTSIQGKVAAMHEYKKGVMQTLFSGKLRFKDENGNPYPAWEEKRLGDLGSTYNGLTGKTAEDFGVGSRFITYKQIFDSSVINIEKSARVRISPNEKQNKAKKGDIFFTTSSETPNEVGFASVLLEDVDDLYLNSFCFGYRIKESELSPNFAQFLFRSTLFRKEVVKLAQGSTRYNLSKVELMKTVINLPCLEEQQKIADFLTVLDDKIKLEEAKLASAKEFKKALLQRMFV